VEATRTPYWVEQIEVDGDGDVEAASLLWDDEDKVLYVYDENDSLVCADGSPATADMLIAINGKGNALNRPAGSGLYVVSPDATECKPSPPRHMTADSTRRATPPLAESSRSMRRTTT
jgi:hypothetical protein